MRRSPWMLLALALWSFLVVVKSESYGVTEPREYSSPKKSMASGAAVGAAYNAANFAVHTGGRSSNILHVIDKTSNKWYARIDMPHKNVPFHHINVNKAVTGLKDPHIRVSGVTAHAAGMAGKAMQVVNKAAPYLMLASAVYDTVDVLEDWNRGKKNEAGRKVVNAVATNAGGYYGATAGAAYGSMIFPGVGTLIGGLVGGMFGGMAGGVGGDIANDILRL